MTRSTIKKLDIPFQCIGDMWGAIYGHHDDEEFRSQYLAAEVQSSVNGDQSEIQPGIADKSSYILHRAKTITGYLNTVVISRLDENGENISIVTAYPEISTDETVAVKLLEVCEYDSGIEARLKLQVVVNVDFFEHENTFWIFDTRYIVNKDKYKIGSVYKFHIGALVTEIRHRPEEGLTIPMSEETIEKIKETFEKSDQPVPENVDSDFKLFTHDMFAINPLYEDNPEAFFCQERFTGLNGEELHYPMLPEQYISYIFHIKSHEIDEKPGYSIPAYVNDLTFLAGIDDNEGKRKAIFAEGDPVDLKGVLEGYLVE